MKYILLSFVMFTSCFLNHLPTPAGEQPVVVAAPAIKQQQKVTVLQKKLEAAELEQKKAEEEVERLLKEVSDAQLALIRKRVDSYEQQIQKLQTDPQKYAQLLQLESSTLFLKEREMLHQMIQTGPSPSAFEAQVVLDRILRMITEISDGAVR